MKTVVHLCFRAASSSSSRCPISWARWSESRPRGSIVFLPRGVGSGCSMDNPPIRRSMCAQSARQIQSRPFWSGPCRLPYRRLDELMANKFSDGNIHLNYAKKTAQIGSYSAWWGPAVQIPSAPPSSPSVFGPIGESLEIRACARVCNHSWTRRTPSAARIRRIQQNLSGRDLARSMDHRRKFACSWNPANRPDEGRRVRRTPWLRPRIMSTTQHGSHRTGA